METEKINWDNVLMTNKKGPDEIIDEFTTKIRKIWDTNGVKKINKRSKHWFKPHIKKIRKRYNFWDYQRKKMKKNFLSKIKIYNKKKECKAITTKKFTTNVKNQTKN